MNNWVNIDQNFTTELSEEWLNYNFTYEQTKDWISIGLTPEDASFANYLQEKEYTTEKILNYGFLTELRVNYENNIAEKGKKINIVEYYSDKSEDEDESEDTAKEIMMIDRISDFKYYSFIRNLQRRKKDSNRITPL